MLVVIGSDIIINPTTITATIRFLEVFPSSSFIEEALATILTKTIICFGTNKTDRHDITEILLKVVLNTITLPP
jgi:hypothetical protein